MTNEKNRTWKAAKVMEWIRTSDGNTWMCPKGTITDPDNATAEQLAACVNESYNPQNN